MDRNIYQKSDLLVNGSTIAQIGTCDKAQLNSCDEVVDATGLVLLPALINTHIHLWESAFAKYFSGIFSLEDYLEKTNTITKKTNLIEKERGLICDYSAYQALSSGTATILWWRVGEVANRWWMRSISWVTIMHNHKLQQHMKELHKKREDWRFELKKEYLSEEGIFLHSLAHTKESDLRQVAMLKKNSPDLKVTMHIAETQYQYAKERERYDMSPIDTMEHFWLLDEHLILVHGCYLKKEDLEKIANAWAKLVHCLGSNLNISDGTIDMPAILEQGVTCAIATDGIVTSWTLNMWDEAKLNYVYHNRWGIQRLAAQKLLDLMTIDAARVLGKEKYIGSLEVWKKADILIIKPSSRDNIIDNLFIQNTPEIKKVIVDGNVQFSDGLPRYTGYNEKDYNNLLAQLPNVDEYNIT